MAEKRFATPAPTIATPYTSRPIPPLPPRQDGGGGEEGERRGWEDEPNPTRGVTSHPGCLAHAGFPSVYLPLPSPFLSVSLSPRLSNYPLPLFPFKSLSSSVSPLSRRHRSLFSPVSSFTRGISPPPPRHPPVTYRRRRRRRRRRATTAATTPASPTLPNGIVLPLPLRNFQPARSPAATGRDCWAFPSRSRSLSTRIPHIPVCFVLSLHRATGIYLATFCSHLCPFPSLIGFSPSSLFLALALRTLFLSFSFSPTYPMVSNGLNFVEVSSG